MRKIKVIVSEAPHEGECRVIAESEVKVSEGIRVQENSLRRWQR